jgi:hypothetical protein
MGRARLCALHRRRLHLVVTPCVLLWEGSDSHQPLTRHVLRPADVDDPRVRAVPGDPSSAGKSYLELFKKMQDLPSADRPTLYSMQANFLAAIYCMGLGTLSKAFQLFAEAITMSIDGGLHRDVGEYDIFDPIEREVRKRTFWSIYCWDKQSGACFGRPAMIHLRDCDVPEPVILDDEYITKDGLGHQPDSGKSRICAFVAAIRLHIVLEGVLDGCVRPSDFASSPFLSKAAKVIAKRHPQSEALREEEALLEDWQGLLEPHWAYSEVTVGSKDPIRITQAERLHCLENLVKMRACPRFLRRYLCLPTLPLLDALTSSPLRPLSPKSSTGIASRALC